MLTIIGFVLAMSPAAALDSDLARRLEDRIALIPFVDSHSHIPAPGSIRDGVLKDGKYDVPYVLGAATYVAEFAYGNDWAGVKDSLGINAHHAYYRPFLEAFRDLYGLDPDEELTDSNVDEVSRRMDAAHRRKGWYGDVVRRANVKHVLWLGADGRGQAAMPVPYFRPVWGIDEFVYIAGKGKKKEKWVVDELAKKHKVEFARLADIEELIDRSIASFFRNGGVGLKSTSAYFRKLDFDINAPRPAAESAFRKVLAHEKLEEAEEKLLQDYLMTRVLKAVAGHKKPIQFHTGNQQNWGMMPWSDPVELNPLLYTGALYDARFVLLHGGYPYSRKAITLTRYFDNVYLDLAWMALFSPSAAKRVLSEAFDMLDGRRLMFGTDTANLEEFYGTIKITRRLMAEVLAEKIEGGYLSEEVAVRAAERILNRNATDLYGLESGKE